MKEVSICVSVGGGLVISEEADGLVRAVCERLVSIEPKLTEMDTICGDGGNICSSRYYVLLNQ